MTEWLARPNTWTTKGGLHMTRQRGLSCKPIRILKYLQHSHSSEQTGDDIRARIKIVVLRWFISSRVCRDKQETRSIFHSTSLSKTTNNSFEFNESSDTDKWIFILTNQPPTSPIIILPSSQTETRSWICPSPSGAKWYETRNVSVANLFRGELKLKRNRRRLVWSSGWFAFWLT